MGNYTFGRTRKESYQRDCLQKATTNTSTTYTTTIPPLQVLYTIYSFCPSFVYEHNNIMCCYVLALHTCVEEYRKQKEKKLEGISAMMKCKLRNVLKLILSQYIIYTIMLRN
jgi:hypothetical protein